MCDKDSEAIPRVTTSILKAHSLEVRQVAWSHDGTRLASASVDRTAIIWRIGPKRGPSSRDCVPEFVLRGHPSLVRCLAWSLDNSILFTSVYNLIFLWNTKTGVLIKTLENHAEMVYALICLPDNGEAAAHYSGFMSASYDRRIVLWDMDGELRELWDDLPISVYSAAVTPNMKHLVAVGLDYIPLPNSVLFSPGRVQESSPPPLFVSNDDGDATASCSSGSRMIVYDLKTRQVELSVHIMDWPIYVTVSKDSRFALIIGSLCEIHLWDLEKFCLVRKFAGLRKKLRAVDCRFGGIDENYVVSGSEDGNVYVWHRDTGALLEVLEGHGLGAVISVAWNPCNSRMLASCSQDTTIRLWETPEPEIFEMGKGKVKQHWVRTNGTSLPQGFFDESHHRLDPSGRRGVLPSSAHPENVTGGLSSHQRTFFGRVSSSFRRNHYNFDDTPSLRWPRNPFSGTPRRYNDDDIRLQDYHPTAVDVPFTRGKRRNISAAEIRIERERRNAKNASAGSSHRPHSSVTQQSGGPTAPSSSSASPPTVATPTGTTLRPDVIITQAGCWSRIWLFICCVPAQYNDD